MKPPRSFRGSGGQRGRGDAHGPNDNRRNEGGERPRGPQGEGRPSGFGGHHAGKPGGKPGGGRFGAPSPGGKPRDQAQGERRFGPRPQKDIRPRPAGDSRPRPAGDSRPRPAGDAPSPRHGENTLHARPPRREDDAPRPRHAQGGERAGLWLYGTHAVAAALANPARRLRRLLLTEAAEDAIAARLPRPWAITAERAERDQLDRLLGRDAVHQGAALHADPLVAPPLAQVLERKGPLVVLDQLADPRNIGAILRTAAALGAAAVVVQDRHAPEETGALAKAASGALETMPMLRAVNIARTLVALKAAGLFVVGLDADAPKLVGSSFAGQRVALVLGAEGEGLRRLTSETCDSLAGIAIQGGGLLDSLNVASACAIALYELGRV